MAFKACCTCIRETFGGKKGAMKNTRLDDDTYDGSNLEHEVALLANAVMEDGLAETGRDVEEIRRSDNAFVNKLIIIMWPVFAIYLFSQPLLANWANNTWYNYRATYTVYAANGSVEHDYTDRPGICSIPLKFMHCTDGQNFTELALKYRPNHPRGCGCGQGVLGEGLCPMTSYGYTLSDFVSTEPGIAAMLGLGFFPLLGTWKNTRFVNMICKPTKKLETLHMGTMATFQIAYTLWGIVSDCIFPTAHSVLTVVFLGAFIAHWSVTAFISIVYTGFKNIESRVVFKVSVSSITIITLGAIPRIFLTLNSVFDTTFFPNWNRGFGSYAFWLAEVGGLTLTFGAYPILLLSVRFYPELADMDRDGTIDNYEESLFDLRVKKPSLSTMETRRTGSIPMARKLSST